MKNILLALLVLSAGCASAQSSSFGLNPGKASGLVGIKSISINKLECQDKYIMESVKDGITNGLMKTRLSVASDNADLNLEGVIFITHDAASSSDSTAWGNYGGSSSTASAGGYVGSISVKIFNKAGDLMGTATVSQNRMEGKAPNAPATEGIRLGVLIGENLDKDTLKMRYDVDAKKVPKLGADK